MRMFLAESFHWLKAQEWKEEAVTKLVSSWSLGPLKPLVSSERHSLGVAYQLVDILVEELSHGKAGDEVGNLCL